MKRLVIAALLIVGLGVSGLVCERVAVRGRFAAAYSTYGAGPTGTRGLYMLLGEMGFDARRQSEDFSALPKGGMLVALGGCEEGMAREVSRYEQEELDRWIGEGGTLVVAGAREYLPHGFGIGFAPEPRCTRGWRLRHGDDDGDEDYVSDEDYDSEYLSDAGTPLSNSTGGTSRDAAVAPEGTEQVVIANDASATPSAPNPEINWVALGPDGGVLAPSEGEVAQDPGGTDEASADEGNAEPAFSAETAPDAGAFASNDMEYWNASLQATEWTTGLADPLQGLGIFPLKKPGTLAIDEHANHTPVLGIGERIHGTIMPRGRGRVIWLASASPFQNGQLRGEGAVLFARLADTYAPGATITFDEYHLGVGEKRSLMSYLRRVGVLPFVLQVVIALLVMLWRGGARFGGVQREVESPPQGTASYVSSMASLLERVKDPRGVIQVLLRQALRTIAQHYHLSTTRAQTEPRHLIAALEQVGHPDAARAVQEIVEAASHVDAQGKLLSRAARQIDDATQRTLQTFRPSK